MATKSRLRRTTTLNNYSFFYWTLYLQNSRISVPAHGGNFFGVCLCLHSTKKVIHTTYQTYKMSRNMLSDSYIHPSQTLEDIEKQFIPNIAKSGMRSWISRLISYHQSQTEYSISCEWFHIRLTQCFLRSYCLCLKTAIHFSSNTLRPGENGWHDDDAIWRQS